jgi:uncharacterized membrane protein (DUF441 family)
VKPRSPTSPAALAASRPPAQDSERSRARILLLLGGLGLLLLLRLPSLIEPAWYADEGTYSDIGRALDRGAVLYRDVWDNKPPGIYWLTALLELPGPSVAVLHAALALFVTATAAGVWLLGRRAAGLTGATISAAVFLVLAALPNLDGDTYNAEPLGAALATLGLLLLVTGRGWELPAGALLGLALLFKEVFAAELLVGLAVPALLAGGRFERPQLVTAGRVAAGAAVVFAVAAVPLVLTGTLGSALDALTVQDVKYVGWSNGIGGGPATLVLAFLTVTRLAIPVAAGAVVARTLLRRAQPEAAVVALWLGCDLAAVMLSARGLTHYVQQAEPALALAAGLLAVAALRRARRFGPALAAGLLLITFPVAQLALWVPRAEVALAQGETVPPWEHNNFRTWQLPAYYFDAWQRATGRLPAGAYAATFPGPVERQSAVARLFRDCSTPGQRVFVWGTVHWSYALSDRLPAGRYVSLNSAYSLDPAAEQLLLGDLTAHPPAVLVAAMSPPAVLLDWLQRHGYTRSSGEVAGYPYWLAPGQGSMRAFAGGCT